MATEHAHENKKPEGPPPTAKQVIRYATEQLHSLRPQPPGIVEMIAALTDALKIAEEEQKAELQEDPPKDVNEAISRIDAMVGRMENPPKAKPELKKLAEGSGAHPGQEAKPAPGKLRAG